MNNDPFFQPYGQTLPASEGTTRVADIDPRLTRTHYFDGRLLTAEDLNRDMLYVDQRLRESGRALGAGVVKGLETRLDKDNGIVVVEKGIGIALNGRVLELQSPLTVNLGNRALIAELNDGKYRHFNRGLYAVVLRYAEMGQGIAEVFPSDLGAKKSVSYDQIAEGVEINLVPLPYPMPLNANELFVRALLIKDLLGAGQQSGLVPEDSVPLGVLAIVNDRPLWLDAELLRFPLRSGIQPGDLQADLLRLHEKLFYDVLSYRNSAGLGEDFPATEYFHLLPPIGHLPKATIEPVKGKQTYFPEHYKVWVAPIRKEDLAILKSEAMQAAPFLPADKTPADVVVLAPLGPQDFTYFAQQLEMEYDPQQRKIFPPNLLSLRLYPYPKPHKVDDDAVVWEQLWERVASNELIYMRRPIRAAESGISAVVLARGFEIPELPPLPEEPTDVPPDEPPQPVLSEGEVFLKRVNFDLLLILRPPQLPEVLDAVKKFAEMYAQSDAVVLRSMKILMRIERYYNDPIWMVIIELARLGGTITTRTVTGLTSTSTRATLADSITSIKPVLGDSLISTAGVTLDPMTQFLNGLLEIQTEKTNTGEAVLKVMEGMSMDPKLIEQWKKYAETGP